MRLRLSGVQDPSILTLEAADGSNAARGGRGGRIRKKTGECLVRLHAVAPAALLFDASLPNGAREMTTLRPAC
jgi:hypothetical protein